MSEQSRAFMNDDAAGEASEESGEPVHCATWSVAISHKPLSIAEELEALPRSTASTGAMASFTGFVRGEGITAMSLEHYPGMTERSIEETIEEAARRWPIEFARVIHRVGELQPGDPIVWVATLSPHRAAAFSACEYIMDYLKVSAPLWKREQSVDGEWVWVDAKASDDARVLRWNESQRARHNGASEEKTPKEMLPTGMPSKEKTE